ncbi:MAG: O-antigen ligase family protein [Chthoniobacterales bacterium]|nr:O-antigen ligase family protein [Chthoniobacterales bacterium]
MQLVCRHPLGNSHRAMQLMMGEKIKALLIGFIGLFLALVLGLYIGSSDYTPILLGVPAAVGLFLWFGTGQWFWPLVIASSYLGGTFPILGGSFTPFQILMAVGVGKFVVEEVIMRRASFAKVDRSLLLALAGFMIIMTGHGVLDRFGMRFLGSHVWGGRNYVNVYVGLIAFFVTQSVSVAPRTWNRLPYLVLAVTGFDLSIAAITTVFPSLIYKIYPFYSAVGTAGITELLTGQEDLAERVHAFGSFGGTLALVVLAAISVPRLMRLQSVKYLALIGMGALLAVYSGFRSVLANLLVTFMAAGYRDLRFRVLAFVPVIAAVLFGLSAFNSSVHTLPKQMQRALVFLPGDWDTDMAGDARASNDFRGEVWTLWWREYFPEHPIFGRGFGFRSEYTKRSLYVAEAQDYQQMVEVGNIHNGLFAALDAVGLVGTIFFAAWNVLLLGRTFRVTFDKSNPAGFGFRFLALVLAVSIICYWFGATTLGNFLPLQFALAGIFLSLERSIDSKPAVARSLAMPERTALPRQVVRV